MATPGDENGYSLLSHLRHLLASDPMLSENGLPGGLVLWLTQNVSKVEEWASAARGDWHGSQTSDGEGQQIHRHMLRLLEYLDGMRLYALDVPAHSPWLVDPVAGKLGLLERVTHQQAPTYLAHVAIHLNGLAQAPGHTQEQQQLAHLVERVISRMTKDLEQVRQDARVLASMSAGQVRLPEQGRRLNEIARLASEVQSGWFDVQTGENVGGGVWISNRLQRLAVIPILAAAKQ